MAKTKTETTTLKTYTIPLRKEFLKVPKVKRAKKSIKAIREFLIRHTKTETIKIGPNLNKKIWKDGIQSPPPSVKVNVQKEKDILYVELSGFKIELPKEKQKKKETPSGLAGKVGKLLQDKKGKEDKKDDKEETKKEDTETKEEKLKDKEEESKEEKEPKKGKTEQEKVLTKKDNSSMY